MWIPVHKLDPCQTKVKGQLWHFSDGTFLPISYVMDMAQLPQSGPKWIPPPNLQHSSNTLLVITSTDTGLAGGRCMAVLALFM